MWYGRRAMSQPAARSANLLGTVGLAVSDRIRAAGEDELGLGGSAPIAIVALSTYLADRPLDEIAGAFGITASAVVRLVDRLEEEGLARPASGARRAPGVGAAHREGRAPGEGDPGPARAASWPACSACCPRRSSAS